MDSKAVRIMVAWVSALIAVFVFTVIILVGHFINGSSSVKSSGNSEVAGVSVNQETWYDLKSQYDELNSLSSLPLDASSKDVLYTKEYQVSRSFGKVTMSDIEEMVNSASGNFEVCNTPFTDKMGARLVSLKSDEIVLVFNLGSGLVAVGTSNDKALDFVNANYGKNGDLVSAGFTEDYSTTLWDFSFKNTVEVDEEVMSNEF